jgi:hypothetical protein
MYLTSSPGNEESLIPPTASAAEHKVEPVHAFFAHPNAKGDASFNNNAKDMDSSSRLSHRGDSEVGGDSSNKLFKKYETQPVQMLRKKIQTIEMENVEKNRSRYRYASSLPFLILSITCM